MVRLFFGRSGVLVALCLVVSVLPCKAEEPSDSLTGLPEIIGDLAEEPAQCLKESVTSICRSLLRIVNDAEAACLNNLRIWAQQQRDRNTKACQFGPTPFPEDLCTFICNLYPVFGCQMGCQDYFSGRGGVFANRFERGFCGAGRAHVRPQIIRVCNFVLGVVEPFAE